METTRSASESQKTNAHTMAPAPPSPKTRARRPSETSAKTARIATVQRDCAGRALGSLRLFTLFGITGQVEPRR